MNNLLYSIYLFFSLLLIVNGLTSNAPQQKVLNTTTLCNNKGAPYQSNPYCVLNVHGLHNTGTGVLRIIIKRALPEEILNDMTNTNVAQDEGQHLQHVYPSFAKRTIDNCTGTTHDYSRGLATRYTCPNFSSDKTKGPLLSRDQKCVQLWDSWSKYWHLDEWSLKNKVPTILLQKTPTADIRLLNDLLPSQSALHAVLMRHPAVVGRPNWKLSYLLCVETWIAVWSNIIDQLSHIQNYSVFRYEDLVSASTTSVDSTILNWVSTACPKLKKRLLTDNKVDKIMKIKEVRGDGLIDSSHTWSRLKDTGHVDSCKLYKECWDKMKAGEDIMMSLFGYSLLEPEKKSLVGNPTPLFKREGVNLPYIRSQLKLLRKIFFDSNDSVKCGACVYNQEDINKKN